MLSVLLAGDVDDDEDDEEEEDDSDDDDDSVDKVDSIDGEGCSWLLELIVTLAGVADNDIVEVGVVVICV